MTYTTIPPVTSGETASKSTFADLVIGNFSDHQIRMLALEARNINAGTGLSGGGDLSADRTLSVLYGTAAGTAAQGNDSRITGAAQKSSNLSDLASASTARTNLGLGGAAVLNVGTASSTVAAGDDPRFTANGRWYATSTSAITSTTGAVVPYNTIEDGTNAPASGMSLSSGIVTITNGGRYDLMASFSGTNSTASVFLDFWLSLVSAGATSGAQWGRNRQGIAAATTQNEIQAVALDVYLAAGATVAAFIAVTAGSMTPTNSATHRTNLAIKRVG